jgi:hypothetical protein
MKKKNLQVFNVCTGLRGGMVNGDDVAHFAEYKVIAPSATAAIQKAQKTWDENEYLESITVVCAIDVQ